MQCCLASSPLTTTNVSQPRQDNVERATLFPLSLQFSSNSFGIGLSFDVSNGKFSLEKRQRRKGGKELYCAAQT